MEARTTTSPVPRRAYAVYDARVVFTVDLASGRVELADLYAESLEHFDTGLDTSPGSPEGWAHWQRAARASVSRFLAHGLDDARLRWSGERSNDE